MDEFDRAIMEALNEAVPSTAAFPGLADRLVVHTRRRKRKRNVLLFFGIASAAMGAVLTTTAIVGGDDVSEAVSQDEALVVEASPSDDGAYSADSASAAATTMSETAASTSENTEPTTQQQNKGANKVKTTLRKASAVLASAIALTSARLTSASSEEYQFIISGYPAEDISYSADSEATALVTGTMSADYDAEDLEARYRTWSDSPATGLNSRKYYGFSITIK